MPSGIYSGTLVSVFSSTYLYLPPASMKGCGVGAGGVREAATHFSAEIKTFANRMETERGTTKVGVTALRSAVKKSDKHLKVKDVFLGASSFSGC